MVPPCVTDCMWGYTPSARRCNPLPAARINYLLALLRKDAACTEIGDDAGRPSPGQYLFHCLKPVEYSAAIGTTEENCTLAATQCLNAGWCQ